MQQIDELIGIDMYTGEKVIHQLLCPIHFQVLQESAEFPWQMCEQTLNSVGHNEESCTACELEQTVIRCGVCGGESEHDWEVHVAEMKVIDDVG